MTKLLLLVAVAAISLVGCNPKDSTPVVFQYDHYAYVVKVSPETKPSGLVAFEVTFLDENGQKQTKTITESWSYLVPAKKGFKMEMTSKMVLAPGAVQPTSGKVDYFIEEGITGTEGDKSNGKYFKVIFETNRGWSYTVMRLPYGRTNTKSNRFLNRVCNNSRY